MKAFLRGLLIIVFLFAVYSDQLSAQSIFTNAVTAANPNNDNPYMAEQVFAANITVSGIGRGTGVAGINGTGHYDATGWNTVGLDLNDYFTFTLTPASGFEIDFTSFVYTGFVSGASPTSFAFRSSVDNFVSNIGTPTAAGSTISLSAAAYQNITSSITFRIYGFNAANATGVFGIDNFTFNGTVGTAAILSADLADLPANGLATAGIGETITYKNTITNTSTNAATSVTVTNTAPANTTFTAGSHKTSALARDDSYSTFYNTTLSTGSVKTNDFGLPSVSILSFGTTASGGTTTAASTPPGPGGITGITNQGGSLIMFTDGTFRYTPLAGFSGIDQFKYIATTGVAGLPNDNATVSITVASDITFSTTDLSPACNGASTGSITFTGVSGGAGGYTYSITGAGGTYFASPSFTGLSANTYTLAVKDANGYIKTGSTILNNPAAITASTTNTNPACNNQNNGSIVFTAAGGTGTLTYSITGTGGTFQVPNSFTGLAPGTYTPVVKDANNCTSVGSNIVFTNPLPVAVAGSVPQLTYNASMATATFTKSGGTGTLTFSMTGMLPTGVTFNAAAGTLTGTPAQTGNFLVTIIAMDANNCTGSLPVTVSVKPNLGTDTYNAVVANTQLVSDGHSSPSTPSTPSATNILTNDQSDVAITVTAVTNVATVLGGRITIDAEGKFTYTPPVGNTAADNYTYTATSNSVSTTAVINFTFPSTRRVWYVNNTYAGADGVADGRSNRPFTDVASAETQSSSLDFIYVHTGSGSSPGTPGNALLKTGQTLRGNGSAFSFGALGIPAGPKPTLTGMITLSNNVFVDGFDMNTATTTAITNAGTTVTGINVNLDNITTTTGTALSLTNTGNSGGVTFASVNTGAAPNAVNVASLSGTLTISAATVTGTTGTGISLTGVTATTLGTSTTAININQTSQTALSLNATPVTLNGNLIITTNAGGAGVSFGGGNASIAAGANTFSVTNTGSGAGIVSTAGTIFITGSNNTISTQTGTALNLANTAIGAATTFVSVTANSLNSGTAASGISLTNVTGSAITIGGGTITGGGATAFNISGGAPAISYAGPITQANTQRLINIASTTGGNIIFSNGLTGTASNTGINLTNNAGATINFTGGISLTTGTNAGFTATGGGTINVTQNNSTIVNTIITTTGTALNVANTIIGGGGLTFRSISANGATKGIILNNTGAGSFTITGTGTTNGSGGTIQNISARGIEITNAVSISLKNIALTNANTTDAGTCGAADNSGCNAALYLNTVTGVILDNIDISGTTTQQGINIREVNGFQLLNSTIANAGAGGSEEGGVYALNLFGTCVITNTTISLSAGRHAVIYNVSKTLGLTVTGSTFNDTQTSPTGADAFEVSSFGNSITTLDFVNSSFLKAKTNGLQVIGENTSATSVDVTGCTIDYGAFAGGGGATDFATNGTATMNFNITGNPVLKGALTSIVNLFAMGTGSSMQGRVNNNTVTCVTGSGSGIRAVAQEGSSMKVEIAGNTVSGVANDNGIDVLSRAGTGRMDAIISANNVTVGATANAFIRAAAGASGSTFNNKTCAWVKNNVLSGGPGFSHFEGRVVGAHELILQGGGGSMTVNWNNNANSPLSPPAVMNPLVSGAGIISYTGTCNAPTNPVARRR